MNAIGEMRASMDNNNALIEKILLELDFVKNKCITLEEKNISLEKEVKFLNRQIRRNNFLMHNVQVTDNENVADKVKDIFKELNLSIPDYAINNCFRLGKGPILISLNSTLVKNDIFKYRNDLKNRNIFISHDRTPEEREEGKIIHSVLTKLKLIDETTTYRKGFFKFQGNYFRLKEIENFVNSSSGNTQNLLIPEQNNQLKKKKIEEKLDKFRFRQRSFSVSQVSESLANKSTS